jgi:hypothetical protein
MVDARSASPLARHGQREGYKVRIFTKLTIRDLKV